MTSGTSWRLVNDIDCSDTINWNSGLGFAPIGNGSFTPDLDGQGHTITGLYINRPSSYNVGLFGSTSGGSISNLRLKKISVTGWHNVGGLGGSLEDVNIRNILIDGKIKGYSQVGGLLGFLGSFTSGMSSNVTSIIVDGSVISEGRLGGIVGSTNANYPVTISDVINTATLTSIGAFPEVGGIVGQINAQTTILNAMNVGPITTNGTVGGIVGYHVDEVVRNTLSLGRITPGTELHGGVIGGDDFGSVTENSYWSTGDTGESTVAGRLSGTLTGGGSVSNKAVYRNTSLLAPLNAWDFASTWQTAVGSLPQLRGFSYASLIPALPAGHLGVAYNQPVGGNDTHGPTIYTISSGALPAGLTLDATTGLLSGRPTTSGSFSITLEDRLSSITQHYTFTLNRVAIKNAALPVAASPSARAAILTADSHPSSIEQLFGTPPSSTSTNSPESQQSQDYTSSSLRISWWWLLPLMIIVLILLAARRRKERRDQ